MVSTDSVSGYSWELNVVICYFVVAALYTYFSIKYQRELNVQRAIAFGNMTLF